MNVTEVVFSGFHKTQICGLYQYDYGQVLKFTDITLPPTYEVHFAQSGASTTVTVLGDENGVQIPDQYLLADLDIKAYIYLHEEETDGETVYQVLIPVIARPEPTDVEPTPVEQDIITQAIAALNTAVTESSTSASDAAQSASDAAQSAQDAAESAASIDMSNYATKAALQSEESARSLADTSLGNDINAETQRATQAEASIRLAIPSKTSQLQNDSGFLTSAPVSSVNGKTGAVSLTASDVGALPASTAIPSKTSDLQNDSNYITASEAPVQSVNGMTGAVTISTATTSANGLMSSQDKVNLDAVRGQIGDLKNALNQVIEPFTVTNSGVGGVNVAYPMAIGESIIVTNQTPASVEVRQRNNAQTVIATTVVLSGNTTKITSTVDSTDIRFYFNQGGTIYFENGDTRLPVLEEKIGEINELKSVDTFLINQLIDGKLIFNKNDYNSDQLNTEVVVAEFDVDGVYDTVYVKADSISNVTNNYPIGVKEYDSNNTQIGITGRLQSRILNGVSIPITNSNTVKVKVYINVGTNSANSFKNLFIWRTKTGRLDNKPYPVFHVEKDGSGDYTSLVNAINEANRHMDAKVYLGAGTWDIIEELGTDYLSNVGDTQRGLYLKNRVHLICDSRSKIVANYTGDLDGVKTWLSIFNSGEYGFTLENATLEGSNIRYLIHDERDQDTDAYTNKYINCTMVFDNRNNTAWSAKQCIGGGLGQNGYIDIEGCTFKSYQGYGGTVSYHNTGASTGRSHIVMRDCYFYLYNTFRLSWYGTSTEITEAVITGCYLGADIVHRAENSSATVENTSIVAWNNTINPHS